MGDYAFCLQKMRKFVGVLLLVLLSISPATVVSIPWPQPLWAALRSGSVQPSDSSNSRGSMPTNGIRYGIGVSEEGRNSPDWQFAMLSKRSRAPWGAQDAAQRGLAVTGSYDPAPLSEQEMEKYYLSEAEVQQRQSALAQRDRRRTTASTSSGIRDEDLGDLEAENRVRARSSNRGVTDDRRWRLFGLSRVLPNVRFRCDPLINFKLKQRLVLLGACVTLGLDYLSDIAQWRSYCAIEDSVVQGRFSLRGSELGWAKAWMLNLGLGEEHSAKLKLRLGLNLRTQRAYAKLRFRTEPVSPFDIGEGLSCAGKLPLPVHLVPALRSVPLRVEYRLRLNTARPPWGQDKNNINGADTEYSDNDDGGGSAAGSRRRRDAERKAFLTSSIGTLDVSLDELNFCLEWDEKSPVWGVGLVRSGPVRRGSLLRRGAGAETGLAPAAGTAGELGSAAAAAGVRGMHRGGSSGGRGD